MKRPAAAPRRIPAWAWKLDEWYRTAPQHRAHHRPGPRRIPAWFWAWRVWRQLLAKKHPKPAPAVADARGRAVKIMRLLLAHEPAVHYAQVRPMQTSSIRTTVELDRKLANGGITMDCSESATLICRLAGLPDPNGNGWDGTGYTGTILAHLWRQLHRRINPKWAKPGDLVVFGPGTGHHICTVLEADPAGNPLLFSHGQERGPLEIRLEEEAAYQPKPVVCLRVA